MPTYIAATGSVISCSRRCAVRRSTAGAVLARWGPRFGFTTLADIASLPLLLLLMTGFMLIITPVTGAFTRHVEHEAGRAVGAEDRLDVQQEAERDHAAREARR